MSSNQYFILEGLLLIIFFCLMIFSSGNLNKHFIQFVLLFYPFMSLSTFSNYGYPNLFDITTIIFVVLFYQPTIHLKNIFKPYQYFIVLLVFSIFFGLYYSKVNSYVSVESIVQYFSLLYFAKIIVIECVVDNKYFYDVIKFVKVAIIFSFIFLLIQFLFGPTISLSKSLNENIVQGEFYRYTSYFQDPQKYAQFLSIGFFITLITFKIKYNIIKLILPILTFIAILFTGGRAAFVGLLLGIVILILFGSKIYRIGVVLALSVLLLIGNQFATKISIFNRTSTINESYEFRNEIWKDAVEIWKKSPLFGIGIGNYAKYVDLHNPDQYWISENRITIFDHPENGYLKILTEFGLVGFIGFFACILFPVILGISSFSKSKDYYTLLLIVAILSWLIGFVTVYSLGDVRIGILLSTTIALLIYRPNKESFLVNE